jgi:hypothetical protein
MPVVSSRLQVLVNCDNLEHEVELSQLACTMIASAPFERDLITRLLGQPSGKIHVATLFSHLDLIARSDSAVRDILTSGHLGKLLSRWSAFLRTSDHRIIGMPNHVLDKISQMERSEYFTTGASLDLDAEATQSLEAQMMMEREKGLMARGSGIGTSSA